MYNSTRKQVRTSKIQIYNYITFRNGKYKIKNYLHDRWQCLVDFDGGLMYMKGYFCLLGGHWVNDSVTYPLYFRHASGLFIRRTTTTFLLFLNLIGFTVNGRFTMTLMLPNLHLPIILKCAWCEHGFRRVRCNWKHSIYVEKNEGSHRIYIQTRINVLPTWSAMGAPLWPDIFCSISPLCRFHT